MDLSLDRRTGWPAELRFLIERYPRAAWESHVNLGMLARFWLERHEMFRQLGRTLQSATAQFRDGTASPQQFQAWFVPRLQFFLSQLNVHHQVEDHHYFPALRAAERRLVRGFEVLDQDHHALHAAIGNTVDRANEFLRSMAAADEDARRHAGDGYADASGRLLKQLLRHLEDEEDLIIPVLLDRGEQLLAAAG